MTRLSNSVFLIGFLVGAFSMVYMIVIKAPAGDLDVLLMRLCLLGCCLIIALQCWQRLASMIKSDPKHDSIDPSQYL